MQSIASKILFQFQTGHILDLEKAQEHDNCGYAFASPATHLFLPQTHNKY